MPSFTDCRSGWSKEPQWENDCGSFLPCFLLVATQQINLPVPEGCTDQNAKNFDPTARSDDGTCVYDF